MDISACCRSIPRISIEVSGVAMIHAVEDRCRQAGCAFLDIEVVHLREELPPFYHQFGFVPTGEAPFTDPEKLRRPAHLVVMTKPL